MLNGLFDIHNCQEYLTENGDMCPNLKKLVSWEDFRGELEFIYDHERKSNAGRRPFDVVLMFKILILQSLYNLSDDEMEYQIMDRLNFMSFLGLGLDSRVPDAKTIWLFRSKLEERKLTRQLFDKFNAFLAKSGFVARKGQIIDATIVRVPIQCNTKEENKVNLGLRNIAYNMDRFLHFDAAERIKRRILQKNRMKSRLFQSWRYEKEESTSLFTTLKNLIRRFLDKKQTEFLSNKVLIEVL